MIYHRAFDTQSTFIVSVLHINLWPDDPYLYAQLKHVQSYYVQVIRWMIGVTNLNVQIAALMNLVKHFEANMHSFFTICDIVTAVATH